ncbi:MAG: ImmA/IrrE family metallo-endopeptidase [Opitutaceae bacterium]|nr:ImmA/IrrE family metallo-endopeptidase [Opitutaceae bacterium]
MSDWKALARLALRGALETRRSGNVPKAVPVCVFDLAERLKLEVRFCAGGSFEGMYAKGSNVILVPSLRPPGRQAFTGAHEMGHWYFGHGSRIDELPEFAPDDRNDPEEWSANLFAAYLLMPSWAVESSFNRRVLDPKTCTAVELYAVACELGVGYETLVQHLRWSLRLISPSRAAELANATPKSIREHLLGNVATKHLMLADVDWITGNIDLQVGHTALLPADAVVEGGEIAVLADLPAGRLVQAKKPGIARAFLEGREWAKFLRVSRADFEGRSLYRHLDDPDAK